MALSQDDYKFPDEQEEGAEDTPAPEFEIEVEDDTPVEDRNRTPMPKPLVEELEADDLDAYDGAVKEKLKQMRKVWHDERREKEAALREHQEAVAVAQRLLQENRQIRGVLTTGEQDYIATAKHAVELQINQAKRDYRDAYEAGDTEKLIEAQQRMQEANLRMVQVQNFQPPSLQLSDYGVQLQSQLQSQPQAQPQQVRVEPKAEAWQERNPWFGANRSMTAFALGVHDELKDDGVPIGSDEYYRALDKTMRKRFPEAFNDAEPASQSRKPSTVVAPATRSTAPKKVRLRQSQLNLIKKLGITPEQYVKEFVKENSNG